VFVGGNVRNRKLTPPLIRTQFTRWRRPSTHLRGGKINESAQESPEREREEGETDAQKKKGGQLILLKEIHRVGPIRENETHLTYTSQGIGKKIETSKPIKQRKKITEVITQHLFRKRVPLERKGAEGGRKKKNPL